ncbi:MAG: hypothetical protein WC548_00365 [Candidatus Pacearchaeota archaeon]
MIHRLYRNGIRKITIIDGNDFVGRIEGNIETKTVQRGIYHGRRESDTLYYLNTKDEKLRISFCGRGRIRDIRSFFQSSMSEYYWVINLKALQNLNPNYKISSHLRQIK